MTLAYVLCKKQRSSVSLLLEFSSRVLELFFSRISFVLSFVLEPTVVSSVVSAHLVFLQRLRCKEHQTANSCYVTSKPHKRHHLDS